MQLHQLKSNYKKKSQKRVGRGGKRGTYSGRGVKGQKSRAGRRIRKAERDLIIRLPKKKGFKNKPKSDKPFTLALEKIVQKAKPIIDSGKPLVIDQNFLRQTSLIPKSYEGKIKVLSGKKDVSLPLVLKGLKVSESTKLKIEKAKGRIE